MRVIYYFNPKSMYQKTVLDILKLYSDYDLVEVTNQTMDKFKERMAVPNGSSLIILNNGTAEGVWSLGE